MSKYIDTDLLKSKLKDVATEFKTGNYYLDNSEQAVGYENALIDFEQIIDSLQQEQPSLPDNLDKAAEKWCKENNKGIALCADGKSHYLAEGMDAFKAGAEWQKEQMLKDAVEGDYDCQYMTPAVFLDKYLDGIKDGDKVRIIVVKEEK